jgi:hypothetical protein
MLKINDGNIEESEKIFSDEEEEEKVMRKEEEDDDEERYQECIKKMPFLLNSSYKKTYNKNKFSK